MDNMKPEMVAKFWGVRGSTTVTEQKIIRGVGGYTSCLQITVGSATVIVDGGSGLRNLGNWIMGQPQITHLNFFMTHPHNDHYAGFEFFTPIYARKNLVMDVTGHASWKRLFETHLFDGETFPVRTVALAPRIEFHTAEEQSVWVIPTGTEHNLVVQCTTVNHPGGCFAYKFSCAGKSIVVVFDHEKPVATETAGFTSYAEQQRLEDNLVRLCTGADVVIIECQYHLFDDERIARYMPTWGHEHVEHLAEVLRQANPHLAVYTHHDPSAMPALVKRIAAEGQRRSGIRTLVAREGNEVRV